MQKLTCAPILLGVGLSMAPPLPPASEWHFAGSRSEKAALALTPQTATNATGRESHDSGKRKHRLHVVEVVGCLSSRPNDSWALTKATQPTTVDTSSAKEAEVASLGNRTFRLMGLSIFNPSKHANHKVRVQGLPVKDAINVTSLAMLSEDCTK